MIRVKFSALAFAAMALVATSGLAALAQGEADQPNPPRQDWSFSGMFGIYDKAQLQRGFQVYKEVCSTCHALSIPFRTLADPDGPGFSEDQVKTLAATYQVTNAEPNEKGEIFKRPATPADIIPRPEAYPNDQAAAAALGKAPPDMALLGQGVEIRARFSLVCLRRAAWPGISGDGRRLHPRDPDRLYEAGRPAVELILPRAQDRDAAADHQRRR